MHVANRVSSVLQLGELLFDNELLSDLKVSLQSESQPEPFRELRLHSVFALRSGWLAERLPATSVSMPVHSPDHAAALIAAFRFVYTDSISLCPRSAARMLDVAYVLRIPPLIFKCCDYLNGNMTIESAASCISHFLHGHESLHDRDEAERAIHALVETAQEFLALHVDMLSEVHPTILARLPASVLQHALLHGDRFSPVTKFEAAAAWARAVAEISSVSAGQCFASIQHAVPFEAMSASDVAEVVRASGLISANDVIELFTFVCARSEVVRLQAAEACSVLQYHTPGVRSAALRRRVLLLSFDATELANVEAMLSEADSLNLAVHCISADGLPSANALASFQTVFFWRDLKTTDLDMPIEEIGALLCQYVEGGGSLAFADLNGTGFEQYGLLSEKLPVSGGVGIKTGERCGIYVFPSMAEDERTKHVVKNVDQLDGISLCYHTDIYAKEDAAVLVEWDNGTPLVAVDAQGKVSVLTVHPAAQGVLWDADADVPILLANVLET